jgi:hypothetical protein
VQVPSDLAGVALELAARGWAVFPCVPKGKIPATPHGFKDASSDPQVVAAAWRAHPNANIGVATGPKSGIVVLDVDGDLGMASLAALQAKYGPLPPTVCQRTGRGRHFFFRYPADVEIHNSAGKIGPGLDVRGDGGYVIVAPSIHPSGARYEWITAPSASVAPWGTFNFAQEEPNHALDQVPGTEPGAGADEYTEGRRNDALFRLARSLKLKGLSHAGLLAAVLAENRTKCKPPLPEAEATTIAVNAYKQPDREGFTIRDVTALPNAIRECVLASKVPLFDRKRGVFGLIRDDLLGDGFFCRTVDSRLYYFSKHERRLYDLGSKDFSFLLTAESGLSATETFFGFALTQPVVEPTPAALE